MYWSSEFEIANSMLICSQLTREKLPESCSEPDLVASLDVRDAGTTAADALRPFRLTGEVVQRVREREIGFRISVFGKKQRVQSQDDAVSEGKSHSREQHRL